MGSKKPIRIAQIMGKLSAGGVESVVYNYYRQIDKNKIQFDFYYDSDSTVSPPQELIEMGANFYKIPPYQKLDQYIKVLRKYFKKNKYVIVHSHINTLSVFPLFAAWMQRIPIRIAHNHSVPGGNETKKNLLKYILRYFSKIFSNYFFACSEKAGRWLFGNRAYKLGKVKIIKNAIDWKKFQTKEDNKKKLREYYNLDNCFVIGHVGRFTYAKNHLFMVDILEQLVKSNQSTVLFLVGDGEMRNEIERYAKQKRLDSHMRIVGQVSNPQDYYCIIDVMIVPSIFEGLSLTTIESQISATPVVVSQAVPEEAVISNGCIRESSFNDAKWAKKILEIRKYKMELYDNAYEYDIRFSARKLQNWYLYQYKKNRIAGNCNEK